MALETGHAEPADEPVDHAQKCNDQRNDIQLAVAGRGRFGDCYKHGIGIICIL